MINNQLFKKVHGCNVGGYVGAALGEPTRRCGGGVFDCYKGLCGPIESAHFKVVDEVLGKPVDEMLPQVKAWTGVIFPISVMKRKTGKPCAGTMARCLSCLP